MGPKKKNKVEVKSVDTPEVRTSRRAAATRNTSWQSLVPKSRSNSVSQERGEKTVGIQEKASSIETASAAPAPNGKKLPAGKRSRGKVAPVTDSIPDTASGNGSSSSISGRGVAGRGRRANIQNTGSSVKESNATGAEGGKNSRRRGPLKKGKTAVQQERDGAPKTNQIVTDEDDLEISFKQQPPVDQDASGSKRGSARRGAAGERSAPSAGDTEAGEKGGQPGRDSSSQRRNPGSRSSANSAAGVDKKGARNQGLPKTGGKSRPAAAAGKPRSRGSRATSPLVKETEGRSSDNREAVVRSEVAMSDEKNNSIEKVVDSVRAKGRRESILGNKRKLSEPSSSSASPSKKPNRTGRTTEPQTKSVGFSALSKNLSKLKKNPRIGNAKKSLCSKDILNLLGSETGEACDEDLEVNNQDDNGDVIPPSPTKPIQRSRSTAPEIPANRENWTKIREPGRGGRKRHEAELEMPGQLLPAGTLSAKTNRQSTMASQQKVQDNSLLGDQSSINRTVGLTQSMTSKVPIWKTMQTTNNLCESQSVDDVFDLKCYGEEEFGPEEEDPKKKKKTRKTKKQAKAILVFGDQGRKKAVATAVKESHNLRTPGAPAPAVKRNIAKLGTGHVLQSSLHLAQSRHPSGGQGPSILPSVIVNYSSDFSTGAQNFFDSHAEHQVTQPEEVRDEEEERPTQENNDHRKQTHHLFVPPPSYKTPAISKKMSKLQSDKSSTPLLEKTAPKEMAAMSTKEMIKIAFGFDDTDEEECSDGDSMMISPVRKEYNPGMSVLENSTFTNITNPSFSRYSTVGSTTGVGGRNLPADTTRSDKKDLPFRFNMVPKTSQIMAQVAAIGKRKTELAVLRQIKKAGSGRPLPLAPPAAANGPVPGFAKPAASPQKHSSVPVRTSPRKQLCRPRVGTIEEFLKKKSKKPCSLQPMLISNTMMQFEVAGGPNDSGTTHSSEASIFEEEEEVVARDPTVDLDIPVLETGPTQPSALTNTETLSVPKPRNAFEVMKNSSSNKKKEGKVGETAVKKVKKLTKKAAKKSDKGLDQSTILEATSNKEKKGKGRSNLSDSRTYSRKSTATKGSTVSFNVSMSDEEETAGTSSDAAVGNKAKPTKKEQKLNDWALHQTSHFSEVEEFDLSFG